ncbi:MAG: hypothetical protein WKF78_12710 [Candidatus Limnocylindrales bacterium]
MDQLTYDPNFGSTGQLPVNGAVILAWSDQTLVPVEIAGQAPKRTGNILYFLPTALVVRGTTTFRNDLLTSTCHLGRQRQFQQGPVQHLLRQGQGRAVLPADRLRWHDRADPTDLCDQFG